MGKSAAFSMSSHPGMRKSDFNKEEHYAKGKNCPEPGRNHRTAGTIRSREQRKLPLQFDVRIQSIRPRESIKGTASVNINGAFAIRGVKIIEGSNGLFVSMPSYKAGNEYKDICFPITQECRKQLHEAVIGAYEQAISQGQDTVAKHHGMQAPEGQPMEMAGM